MLKGSSDITTCIIKLFYVRDYFWSPLMSQNQHQAMPNHYQNVKSFKFVLQLPTTETFPIFLRL